MTKLSNPEPMFLDASGALMDGGHIYVGVANGDPRSNPIVVYFDSALTIPATQPLRTLGGLIVNITTPVSIFFAEPDFSMRVEDVNNALVFYSPSVYPSTAFQPLDADLTTIAGQANTAYGMALLLIGNQAALQAAVGLPAALPLVGGTVTGNILRQGAGVHPYWADAAMTGGKQTISASGGSDLTVNPGDLQYFY
jgi:hypothetical protein